MGDESRRMISIGELKIGSKAAVSYHDTNGVLLIAKGVAITPTLVEKLRRHGIETLHIEDGQNSATSIEQDPPSVAVKQGTKATAHAADASQTTTASPINPDNPALRAYSAEKIRRISRLHSKSIAAVERLTESLARNRTVDLEATDPVIDGYVRELVDDPDPVIASTLLYESNLKLAQRCLQFATLSMAVGQRLDISPHGIRELGQAALLHDIGLFEMPADQRFPHYLMSDETRWKYQQHPIVAETMVQSITGATFMLGVLVAQVHELLDGSGFPRRLAGGAIHPLARILSMVDGYLTLTCPPPGHPRIVPCDAIAFLLQKVSKGQYAPTAATGLLEVLTTYPIGSLVELSDTRRARVVCSNGCDYGFPVVELVSQPGELLDLKEESVFVTRPILSPEFNEVRLPESFTDLSNP